MSRRLLIGLAVLPIVMACGAHRPTSATPIDGAEVGLGSLVQSATHISIDVLIPSEGDVTAALERARNEVKATAATIADVLPPNPDAPVVKIELGNIADEHWDHHLPGYAESMIDPDEFEAADRSAGVIVISARAPEARGWEMIRLVTTLAIDLAASQSGWIYDSYRAELHDAESFASSVPDSRNPDVRTILRVVGVVPTKGGLDHIRTIGLWRLGLPELYVPDVPHEYLDATIELVRATAQILSQRRRVTRRGIIELDESTLSPGWPRIGSAGRFVWSARWMRGPIHDHAMQIVLAVPGARDKDPTALMAAVRAFAGGKP